MCARIEPSRYKCGVNLSQIGTIGGKNIVSNE